MDQDVSSADDVEDGLETVERHINEAEEILWVLADHVGSEAHATRVDEITKHLWELQHEIGELKADIDESTR